MNISKDVQIRIFCIFYMYFHIFNIKYFIKIFLKCFIFYRNFKKRPLIVNFECHKYEKC